ncbi:MAG: 30S ribosomal protein S17e [Nanoarchaeota archaeon]|nr:30S ribosomal protein S17e [Nanoarchaeota archaeon]MBU1704201.1 30S ribosomal protein S17e [Nanoarchaeota archaeon]
MDFTFFIKGGNVGRIKTKLTKRITFEIYRQNKDNLAEDFDKNKEILNGLAEIPSKKLRNTIAGYLTRLVKAKKE